MVVDLKAAQFLLDRKIGKQEKKRKKKDEKKEQMTNESYDLRRQPVSAVQQHVTKARMYALHTRDRSHEGRLTEQH